MQKKSVRFFVLGAALTAGGLFALAVGDLFTFKAGEPIRSSEVNQNFSKLKQSIEAPIGASRLDVGGTAADGKVLKLSDGKLSWADDLTGAGGGVAYSAGSGLALDNNIFSLKDAGISAEKLATQNSASTNQFLAFNGQGLVWAEGTSGSVGPQGPKGDRGDAGPAGPAGPQGPAGPAGPQGPAGTASIGDGSITTAKLANGGVTAAKLGTQNPAAANKFLAFNGSNLVWAEGTSGTAGPQGPKGEKGDTGPAGAPGPKGDAGAPGPKGDTGPQGPVGPQGPSGIVADGSVSTNKLANNAVNTAKLADSAVTAAKLAKGSVTSDKLAFPVDIRGYDTGYLLSIANSNGSGIVGDSTTNTGVLGTSSSGVGVKGISTNNAGVRGTSVSSVGVFGTSNTNTGIEGSSTGGHGVVGLSDAQGGVFGRSRIGTGVVGVGISGYAAEFSGGKFGTGICYFAGGSGWSCTSDKNAKENFRSINPEQVLQSLAKMPITTWNMKGDKSKTLRLGPTAQDFKKAFGLGSDDKTITTSDAQGVAMAAIQGLYKKNQALEAQNQTLKAENQATNARVKSLEERLKALEDKRQ